MQTMQNLDDLIYFVNLFEDNGVKIEPTNDNDVVKITGYGFTLGTWNLQFGVGEVIDAVAYYIKLHQAKHSGSRWYWTVSLPDFETLLESTVLLTEHGGVVVKKDGDITGLFKFFESTARRVADELLSLAIQNGGTKLDNYDGYLTEIYHRNGFRVIARMEFEPAYAPHDWMEAHGRPDVVFMMLDPDNKIAAHVNTVIFEDYGEAMAYRDSFINQGYRYTNLDKV